jgi:hypothetical protein
MKIPRLFYPRWPYPYVVQASACLDATQPPKSGSGLPHSKTWRPVECASEPSRNGLGLTRRTRQSCRAFSLLEMMLVVTMLTMIVYMLYSVFDQIQRALRSNTSQVDIMETGRATLDLVSRELQGIEKSGLVNPFWMVPPPPFVPPTSRLEESRPNFLLQLGYDVSPKQLTMPLVDGSTWTNVLNDCFFLSRSNNIWVATAYMVGGLTNDPKSPANLIFTTNQVDAARVGALVRVTTSTTNWMARHQLRAVDIDDMMYNLFRVKQGRLPGTNVSLALMADGIVHFRMRPLDLNGRPITNTWPDLTTRVDRQLVNRILVDKCALFTSNALPAYVDLEIGILDPAVFQRFKAIPPSTSQLQFLQRQAGAIQLFHKLIPVRSVERLPQP